jgi:hypothetical protein
VAHPGRLLVRRGRDTLRHARPPRWPVDTHPPLGLLDRRRPQPGRPCAVRRAGRAVRGSITSRRQTMPGAGPRTCAGLPAGRGTQLPGSGRPGAGRAHAATAKTAPGLRLSRPAGRLLVVPPCCVMCRRGVPCRSGCGHMADGSGLRERFTAPLVLGAGGPGAAVRRPRRPQGPFLCLREARPGRPGRARGGAVLSCGRSEAAG